MTKEHAIELATGYLGRDAVRSQLFRATLRDKNATWCVDFIERSTGFSRTICVDCATGKCVEMDILQD